MITTQDEEVSRLLHVSFVDFPLGLANRYDLVRLWSLELQWLTPEDALSVLEKLCSQGWLVENEGRIKPNPRVELLAPSLGWQPIVRRVLNPPEFVEMEENVNVNQIEEETLHQESKESNRIDESQKIKTHIIEKEEMIEPALPRELIVKIPEPEKSTLKKRDAPTDRPPDRAEMNIPSLINHIADSSGLANREVVRRAQRKRRSLMPVTLWMALALVAREQGLDMYEIAAIIESK